MNPATPHLGAWVHDLSPWVLRFTPSTGVRWYGISYLAGFLAAFLLLRWLSRRGASPIPEARVADAIMLGVLGVVVGGRLGYVLFYDPSLLAFTAEFPYWGVLAINRGGMASHGGIIGVILAFWRVSRGFKDEQGLVVARCTTRQALDLAAMIAPAGLFFGRLANFVNGELLGAIIARPGQHAPWWSVRYPQEILHRPLPELVQTPEQLEQIQALSFAELTPEEIALAPVLNPADYEALWKLGYERLLERLQHGSSDVARQLEPLLSARAPSQLVQAAAEGLIVAAVVWWVGRRPRLPGVVGCWFLIAYGVLRVATEFVRLPDAHLGLARPAGLTRGQWLSLAMVALGLVILAWIAREGGDRVGGWATRRVERA